MSTGPGVSVVEHTLREREVVGSNPGRATPKALKMLPVATLLGAQRQVLASLLLTNIAQLTLQHLQKRSKKKKYDNNQCLYSPEDCMEDWQLC